MSRIRMWKMYFEIACMFSRPIQPYIIGLAYFYLAKNNIVILSWAMLLSLEDTIRCASLLFVLMRKMSFDETIIESCCAFAWCNFKWDFLFMPTNYHLYLCEIEHIELSMSNDRISILIDYPNSNRIFFTAT